MSASMKPSKSFTNEMEGEGRQIVSILKGAARTPSEHNLMGVSSEHKQIQHT